MQAIAALLFLSIYLENFLTSSRSIHCTDGFTLINSKCLKLFPSLVSHTVAESSCNSYGATLVTVKNVKDDEAIAAIAGSSTPLIWLGLYCFDSDPAQCLWDDVSGSASNYNNFSAGFPLVVLGQCVYYSTQGALAGKWLSEECESQHVAYICELPITYTDNCDFNYNGYCYTFSSTTNSINTFISAQGTCAQDCGYLASIHSPLEIRYINTFAPHAYFYIGAIWKNDGSLYWLDNSPWDYNNIDPVQTNRVDYCLTMSTTNFGSSPAGFWFSTNCNNPGYYICKRQAGVQCSAAPPATVTPSPANPSNCNAGRLMSDGIITSPNFPQNYFNNANCAYQISTLGSMRIALTFTFFNTQPYDLVTIYDGETSSSPVLGKYGGNQSSLTFTSSRNNMLVTFITDGKDTSNGFSARFSSIVYGNI
ncbi:C-type LECtin [Caenorhabditis elegans]|uniref:C-type LECtin n=1 Tax=Caenorhabditis elegans TaxID=6239 RepID=O45867_CAEEL|nr:C-type LECtin [Caenorhabditis elegans]CAB04882.1 C-type LECtin [Caenorhabditis elegans]|eukprot:NP_493166.1 C-type LECtin [Caenorhabditis elegans]